MIVAAVATMPERLLYLENVVRTIRPQVDILRVYLNNFVERPAFLTEEEGRLSHEAAGDLGDLGKLYWLDGKEGTGHSHYMTLDDDIGYPADYAARMVSEFDARGGKAIVGVHGSEFDDPIVDFVTSRKDRFRFYQGLDTPRRAHILGTATTLLSRATIQLDISKDFPLRNAADLQLAVAAQKQRVPLVAVPRPEGWLTELRPWTEEGFSIWKQTKEDGQSKPQTYLAQTAIEQWQLYPDPLIAYPATP